MKRTRWMMAAVVAGGLFAGGCGDYFASLDDGVYDPLGGGYYSDTYSPDGYYSLDFFDGPDYVLRDRGRYYYDRGHRDDHWRSAHARNYIHADRNLRERIARSRLDRARNAGHEIHGRHDNGNHR